MFRQRTSSQKPGDELLENFRRQFPEVAVVTTTSGPPAPAHSAAEKEPVAVTTGQERSHSLSHEAFRDQDPTPRGTTDAWRFTPSLLDPSSFSFSTFANQPPGYYTPTPGGTNTLYHPQAGDLHTPTLALGMGLGTPLSLPTSEGALHSGVAMMDLAGFHHPVHSHHQFQPFNPFIQPPAPQQSFAPSTFVHHDTGYETMEPEGSPMDSDARDERMGSIDSSFHPQATMAAYQQHQFSLPMAPLPPSAEKFRFHTTLNAPTAMIKHADEIPVTYLNKGQAYSLSVIDTESSLPVAPGTRYRTFVRISFEDEQQRQKPNVCWSLWKEGRGSNEAHQRGGKLQAVEYVEASQPIDGDDKRTRIKLETASFDGFSVTWTPGIHGAAECNIAVRFNFLSTDFSHSKGVKGIPVRLCAKTSIYADQKPPPETSQEICYCKVKLFRDHGAERKLSNDVMHVKKTIDKLKQQITQAETGVKEYGKRKRASASVPKGQESSRPGKVPKHKRTWSMSSTSSSGGARLPIEEDLHMKLQTLQDMFTSTRPVSVLYLRGEELDDPDLHPVSLPGEPLDLTKAELRDPNWLERSGRESITGSSLVSPSPSSMSLHSQVSTTQWRDIQGTATGADEPGPSRQQSLDQPTRVNKPGDTGNLSGWIEALGVDSSYRPPADKAPKPVACFYVLLRKHASDRIVAATAVPERFHKAIYLMQRTIEEFVAKICLKWGLDAARVVRVVHILDRGLQVAMDNDVIRELSEGQDMILEVAEVEHAVLPAEIRPKEDWEMSLDLPPDADLETIEQPPQLHIGYELRLIF